MYRVDLNSDLGESFGNYTIGMDEEILKYVSSSRMFPLSMWPVAITQEIRW